MELSQYITQDLLTAAATVITTVGLIYAIVRNFRIDLRSGFERRDKRMDSMDKRMESMDKRMDSFEAKITSIEEIMFWMATGKRLEDALREEMNKKNNKEHNNG